MARVADLEHFSGMLADPGRLVGDGGGVGERAVIVF